MRWLICERCWRTKFRSRRPKLQYRVPPMCPRSKKAAKTEKPILLALSAYKAGKYSSVLSAANKYNVREWTWPQCLNSGKSRTEDNAICQQLSPSEERAPVIWIKQLTTTGYLPLICISIRINKRNQIQIYHISWNQ